jgi:NAD(P)-dependent dehydrogenase (short-subunit alcohol dehydrogenase family)/predicted ester cyclase
VSGKVWFVTGSSRGLGRQVVLAALRAGDRVAATARNPGELADLAAEFAESLLPLRLDVTDAVAAAGAVGRAAEEFGRLDVVVNNAGYADLAAFEDTPAESFRAQVETNLFGVVNVCRAAVPVLRDQGGGHFINVSSLGGRIGTPGLSAYQAAKWAVTGFSEVLAAEVGPLGVKVTVIEPGGMATDWSGSSMRIPAPSAPYEDTIGFLAQLVRGDAGDSALGDPAKAARVIADLARMADPPVRLLLGSDALAVARSAARVLAGHDGEWAEVSRSTDRDDATERERDPLGTLAAEPETVVRRFLAEVVNGGNLAANDELWTEDLVWHGGSLGEVHGLAAFKEFMASNASGAFTGMHLEIHEVISSGGKVVVRFTNSGTQTGPFMGTAPTGKHAAWLGIGIYTVAGGRISEGWFAEDILGMLQHLGITHLPSSDQGAPK